VDARTRPDRATVVAALRAALERQPDVLFACLHGSFVEGGPYRDVDVAVWFDPARVAVPDRLRRALDLGVALGTDLGLTIDVHPLNDAPLAFRYHALAGEPLIVRDEEFFFTLKERTWAEYFDFLPFARQYSRDAR
jgi:predicted nucleotidyltransferase